VASSIDTSRSAPLPDWWRSRRAARIELYAYMPAAMSETEMPTFAISSSLPVTDNSPASLCTRRS
jgi:hypothetical protein